MIATNFLLVVKNNCLGKMHFAENLSRCFMRGKIKPGCSTVSTQIETTEDL